MTKATATLLLALGLILAGADPPAAWAAGPNADDEGNRSSETGQAGSARPNPSKTGGVGENGTLPNRQSAVSPSSSAGPTNATSTGKGVGTGANTGADTTRMPGGAGGGSGATNGGR